MNGWLCCRETGPRCSGGAAGNGHIRFAMRQDLIVSDFGFEHLGGEQ